METLSTLALLFPLALTSGINLYATVLVAGLSMRFGGIQLPAGLEVLQSWPILLATGFFFLLEFFADKIPLATQVWDFAHTFIRPLGMAALGVLLVSQAEPQLVVLAALAAGSMTLMTHASKAGSRIAVDLMAPGGNWLLSLGEDAFAGGMTFFALKYPLIASGLALLIFVAIVIVTPQLMRWSWFTTTSFLAWVRSWFGKQAQSETLPAEYWQVIQHKVPEIAIGCRAQNIKGANGCSGYLVKIGSTLTFAYNAWFSVRVWRLDTRQIFAGQFQSRLFVDVLELHYRDSERKKRLVRFVFQRDRKPLAENLMAIIRNRA